MKLDTEFLKLPLRFDADRLAQEVGRFTEADWKPHPQGYPGNTALSLVAVGGDPASDSVKGPMVPTPYLARCPYLRQVLASFGAVLGRTRLMRLSGQAEATAHVDVSYYWLHHVRVHVPIVTFPEVEFLCGGKSLHMAAGECWIFDTWRMHNVLNPVSQARIHLVADTVGSAAFWELVAGAERPFAAAAGSPAPPRTVAFDPHAEPELEYESFNFPVVMTPWEQRLLAESMLDDLAHAADVAPEPLAQLKAGLLRLHRQWLGLWARYGDRRDGWPAYRATLDAFKKDLDALHGRLTLPNTVDVVEALRQSIVRPALSPELAPAPAAPRAVAEPAPAPATTAPAGRFDRPIFIVAAPRSGSTFLFETLARSPSLVTIGGESHNVFEQIPQLNPVHRGYDSNRLTARDADPQTVRTLRGGFLSRLRDRNGQPPAAGAPVRMLEKTPKNALRIPFLQAAFPDALFIYLFREPHENLSSIVEAWKSGKFVTYRSLPGWEGPPWSLLLIPEWRQLQGADLPAIAAAQYAAAHQHILRDLEAVPADRWTAVTYADLVADPQAEMRRLCRFAGLAWDQDLKAGHLPLSRHTLTPPDPDKWRKNEAALQPVLPRVEPVVAQVRQAIAPKLGQPAGRPVPEVAAAYQSVEEPVTVAVAAPPPDDAPAAVPAPPAGGTAADGTPPRPPVDLSSVHTSSLPKLLDQLGISLMVTTYQAGKLIIVRTDGGKLNTHFRNFSMPMGLALDRRRLVLGTKLQVWEFRNQPEAARKLEPVGKHDACFLPRSTHTTGDIRIHELALAKKELWIVNTRFSCLCTLDREHSFVPRWRPPFVTALAAEDRCHLNGLALRDGRPRYVTCLGATDTAGGWRENKRDGGLLLDVDSGEVLLRGLSMPHSPRWHQDKLWLLESGVGSLALADLKRGRWETVTTLPGFTRGIDFYQHFAFIGLSQVRESAVFSGIPITERPDERNCGVWVVDLRSGKSVGFLRFEASVREIFAVQVLPNVRFPDLFTDDETVLASSFVLPPEALKQVAAGAGT